MNEHIRGNPKAALQLVEYADFECPYCGEAEPYVERVTERFHDKLAVVFRSFPLAEIHPHAMHAAQAAEAAGLQDRFWEMHDVLFQNQRNLDDPALLKYAATIGLDVERFKRDFDSARVREIITESIREAGEQGVEGTPSFFLNGEPVEIDTFEDLEPLVARAVLQVR